MRSGTTIADGFRIPRRLAEACAGHDDRERWLERLPDLVRDLAERWAVCVDQPLDGHEVSSAWVAPATRANGTRVILKAGMPHMEGEQEIAGLRFWRGDPTVLLLEADDATGVMLLERCLPGTALRSLSEQEQDEIIAAMIRRLWRRPPPGIFRPLSAMIDQWSAETRAAAARWVDRALVQEGLDTLEELAASSGSDTLLGTDVHAGNVLRAEREPWLVIDPKPFAGDTAYDATQHLLNCRGRLRSNSHDTITRFAGMLGVDATRAKRWLFGRLAAEPRDSWDSDAIELARRVRDGSP